MAATPNVHERSPMSPAEGRDRRDRLVLTETKHSSKTTEFYAMIAVIAGILVAAWYVGRSGAVDEFRASQAWLYIAIVASAYFISRGLAKSGSHEAAGREHQH
jgi:hypothetical protein